MSFKQDLFKVTFSFAKQLSEKILSLVAGQKEAIVEGVATDTSISDG